MCLDLHPIRNPQTMRVSLPGHLKSLKYVACTLEFMDNKIFGLSTKRSDILPLVNLGDSEFLS